MENPSMPAGAEPTSEVPQIDHSRMTQIPIHLSVPPTRDLASYLYSRDVPSIIFAADSKGSKSREALATAVEKDGFNQLHKVRIVSEEFPTAPFLASMALILDLRGCTLDSGREGKLMPPLYIAHALSPNAYQPGIADLRPDWDLAPGFTLQLKSALKTTKSLNIAILLTLARK